MTNLQLHLPNCRGDLYDCEDLKQRLNENINLIEEKYKCLGLSCLCPPLLSAVRAGHYDCVAIILKAGADPNSRGEGQAKNDTALQTALINRRPDIVALLLKNGASTTPIPLGPDQGKFNYLNLASMTGQVEALRLLLEHGAYPDETVVDSRNLSPAQIAIRYNKYDSFKILILYGAQIERENYSLLDSIVQSARFQTKGWENKQKMLQLLCYFGANLQHVNESGLTVFQVLMDPKYPRVAAEQLGKILNEFIHTPMTLQNACRIVVRRSLGSEKYLDNVKALGPLPPLVNAAMHFAI